MKRRLLLPLLAIPLLFLSCDSETPTQPSANDAVPLFAPTPPLPTTLKAECWVSGAGDCSPSELSAPGNFYSTATGATSIGYDLCDTDLELDKGSVVVYICRKSGVGTWHYDVCDSGEQHWKRVASRRLADSPCAARMFSFGAPASGLGVKLEYRRQGSAYAAASLSVNVFHQN